MTKDDLLKQQTEYYDNVNKWFVNELSKWSKKHNMHLQDYAITRMWVIGSDITYEPYSHYQDDEEVNQFEDALSDYEKLIEDLKDLGVYCWQGLEYSDEAKFLH